jgi:glycosyltransferase involved in cell wall biosynthesis
MKTSHPAPSRIVWLCQFTVIAHPDGTPIPGCQTVTWIYNLARSYHARYPEKELHLVTESSQVAQSYVVATDFGHVHYVRDAYWVAAFDRPWPFAWRGWSRFLLSRLKLGRYLRALQPALVHAHGTEFAYALTALDSGLPYVISLQGLLCEIAAANPRDRIITSRVASERTALLRGRHFIAKTTFAERILRRINATATVYHLENPVHEAFPSAQTTPGKHRAFLFVGRLEKAKGLDELLHVCSGMPDTRLFVIGDHQTDIGRAYRVRYEACSNIVWLGTTSSAGVARAMQDVDALILPSYMDTSPNVIIEAHCAGLPVIATQVGGIPEMVEHGRTGWLIPAKDADALAAAIRWFVEHPAQVAGMGQTARQLALPRYAPALAAEKLQAIYDRIVVASR